MKLLPKFVAVGALATCLVGAAGVGTAFAAEQPAAVGTHHATGTQAAGTRQAIGEETGQGSPISVVQVGFDHAQVNPRGAGAGQHIVIRDAASGAVAWEGTTRAGELIPIDSGAYLFERPDLGAPAYPFTVGLADIDVDIIDQDASGATIRVSGAEYGGLTVVDETGAVVFENPDLGEDGSVTFHAPAGHHYTATATSFVPSAAGLTSTREWTVEAAPEAPAAELTVEDRGEAEVSGDATLVKSWDGRVAVTFQGPSLGSVVIKDASGGYVGGALPIHFDGSTTSTTLYAGEYTATIRDAANKTVGTATVSVPKA